MLVVYFTAKKKGIRRGEKILEEDPGLTISIYGKVYDFCQGIIHRRLLLFSLLNQSWGGT